MRHLADEHGRHEVGALHPNLGRSAALRVLAVPVPGADDGPASSVTFKMVPPWMLLPTLGSDGRMILPETEGQTWLQWPERKSSISAVAPQLSWAPDTPGQLPAHPPAHGGEEPRLEASSRREGPGDF